MNRTIEDWLDTLTGICEGTEHDARQNEAKGKNAGAAIVPKGMNSPQRLCVYPKKTKGASLVLEKDVYEMLHNRVEIVSPNRERYNRLYFYDMSDDTIIKLCRIFVGK